MPSLTMRETSKATTKPWFSRLLRHPARKRSGSILGHKTHTHIYLLIYFPQIHTGLYKNDFSSRQKEVSDGMVHTGTGRLFHALFLSFIGEQKKASYCDTLKEVYSKPEINEELIHCR